MKGFRKGNLPVYETPLRNIVLIGGTHYKVQSRDKHGKPTAFYPHSNFLTLQVLIRISLHNAWEYLKGVNYKEKFRSIFNLNRWRKRTRL